MEIILLLIVLVLFLKWLQRRTKQSKASQTQPTQLMRKLDRLTRDRRTSERLVQKVAYQYPDRSMRWCVEKAIFDIERDRWRS